MNKYEEFLASLTPEQRAKLATYSCQWCSAMATSPKCGDYSGNCGHDLRIEKSKKALGIDGVVYCDKAR